MRKLAVVQMCSTDSLSKNLSIAKRYIQQAVASGASVVALPEMFATLGMPKQKSKLLVEKLGKENQPIQNFLKNQAIENKVWIIGGTVPIESPIQDKAYAACLVYDDTGMLVTQYNKIHLFDVAISENEKYFESDSYLHGNDVVLFDSPIGKIGLAVCYDLRFPELTRQLFQAGADVIVAPTAFTTKTGIAHWNALTRCRAIENQCYLAAPCQTGTHTNGRETYGHSTIIDPWGTVVEELEMDEGLILSEIDHDLISRVRKSMPTSSHTRLLTEAPVNNTEKNKF